MGQTIPFACQDWASTKAAYRFLSNDRVSEYDILSGISMPVRHVSWPRPARYWFCKTPRPSPISGAIRESGDARPLRTLIGPGDLCAAPLQLPANRISLLLHCRCSLDVAGVAVAAYPPYPNQRFGFVKYQQTALRHLLPNQRTPFAFLPANVTSRSSCLS
jgi:hypothetical protein